MKIKLALLALLAVSATVNAASITLNSLSPGGPGGAAYFDNAGNATLDTVLLFTGTSPTDYASALALVGSQHSSYAFPGPGDGLVNGSISPANPSPGEPLTGQDLFIILTNAAQDQFVAYNLSTVIANADTPTPFAAFENVTEIGLITLGAATPGAVSYSALGAPDGTGINVRAAAIPEPSSALLLGLGGLGLMMRRKR